ncbi:hypothetical protein BGZ54_000322 [Gamsiella multidivaricata]|nr:hypothetical protein BGZ54_000322 [Gamsiella multidivaricata]
MDMELEVCIEMSSTAKKRHGFIVGGTAAAHRVLSSSLGCITGTEELKEILEGHETQLQKKMEEAADMQGFLIELVDTLEAILSSQSMSTGQEKPVSYWSSVMEQLDILGWDRVSQMKEDFSQVQIELHDVSQRKHLLTVKFPPGYPTIPFILEPLETPECDLEHRSFTQQLAADTHSLRQQSGLQAVVQQTERWLELFRDFWDVMQDIDEKTWVIDPEKPTRADRMRRCALGMISFDLNSPVIGKASKRGALD